MADEQGKFISLSAIEDVLSVVNDAIPHLDDLEECGPFARRTHLAGALKRLQEDVHKGILWQEATGQGNQVMGAGGYWFTADAYNEVLNQRNEARKERDRLKLENAELRAENERLRKRNEQMAATAQDGINQRDELRRELYGLRESDRERREEVEHLKRELETARKAFYGEVQGKADFHKERFDECHRCATFYEQALIAMRYREASDRLAFFSRWRPDVTRGDDGEVRGVIVPKDWKAPEDPCNESQRPPAPEPTKTAWGEVGNECPPSEFQGVRREIALTPNGEIQVVRLAHDTRIVAAIFSGVARKKGAESTEIEGVLTRVETEANDTKAVYLPEGGKLVALILREAYRDE